jgi:hypothetical protein
LLLGRAPNANNQAGYVQMFRYTAADNNGTAATWSKEGQELDGGNAGDRFGASVAMSLLGKHVIIGAPFQNMGASAVTVWKVDYTYADQMMWKRISKISSDKPGDNFGSSVDISDDGYEIAVGAPYSIAAHRRWSKMGISLCTILGIICIVLRMWKSKEELSIAIKVFLWLFQVTGIRSWVERQQEDMYPYTRLH